MVVLLVTVKYASLSQEIISKLEEIAGPKNVLMKSMPDTRS